MVSCFSFAGGKMVKKGNRQDRAMRLMCKIAVRMSKELGQPLDNHEIDVILEIRNTYYQAVGRIDDLVRRFDLMSIIA